MPENLTSTDVYQEELTDANELLYIGKESRTRIRPGWIFDRIRWRDSWIAKDPKEIDDFEIYESEGYLVTINVTPRRDDDRNLSVDDLEFETTGLRNTGPTLLREVLPEAGMIAHPTDPIPLFEPSEVFDYHTPSGVVVEVEADDVSLTYGVAEDGEEMVGTAVPLPEMDEYTRKMSE